jgi:sulfur relay (sulfurtransferase) DsrC/TusE family protein
MRKSGTLGLVTVLLILNGCASYSANQAEQNDEQVDLYLSTLDDKHFVWCELDLEQCRKDFEKWKLTPRGRMIIREYEKEETGHTYNTHHVPNVFRTRFVDKSQVTEQAGQDSDRTGRSSPSIEQPEDLLQERISRTPKRYGPDVPSTWIIHPEAHESP